MALAVQAPQMQLSEEEGEQYAKAIAAVARHYDLGASAKGLDWTNLVTTMGSIYGLRVMAAVARRKGARRPAPNGHDAAPAAAAESDIDFSSMTGRTN